MKKVVVDRAKCVGSGNCVLSAPQLFTQDEDDGLVRLIAPAPGREDMEAAELAVHSCPAQALRIVDVDG
jgi:ferredoxin